MSDIVKNTLNLANKLKRGIFNFDGFENALTGIGVAGKDKRLGGKYTYNRKTQSELESVHDSSDVAKIVVNKIPELATKKWLNHSVSKEEGGIDTVNLLVDEDERLQVKKKFKQAMAWSRLYGGAGIYMSVEDGLDPAEPLNIERVRKFNSLTVLHKFELQRGEICEDIDDPNFGKPDYFTISGRVSNGSPVVHHSRILIFQGSPLSEQGFRQNDYWNDSLLSVIFETIRDYDNAYSSIFNALQDFDVDILKLKDLADICASDDDDLIKSRLRLMQLSKSIMSAIVIDAEGESFEKLQRQFQNVDKMLDKADKRLQLATGLPHTVLFGEGSTGTLGAGGESEQLTLNDLVAGEQDSSFTVPFRTYSNIVQAAKQGPTSGKILKSWSFSYNKLNEPTDKMVAETRKLVAEADSAYYNIGALSSQEIAESRWGGDEYSMETNINMDARKEQKETDDIGLDEVKKELELLKKAGKNVES